MFFGKSPALQQDFDIERYLGLWHEIYRLKTIKYEDGFNITANYSKGEGKIACNM